MLKLELSEASLIAGIKSGFDIPLGYEVDIVEFKIGTKPYPGPYDPRESNTVPCCDGATITLKKINT